MDMDEILIRLQIINLAKDWPKLRAIHDVAMGELEDMTVEAGKTITAWNKEAAATEDKAKTPAPVAKPVEPKPNTSARRPLNG